MNDLRAKDISPLFRSRGAYSIPLIQVELKLELVAAILQMIVLLQEQPHLPENKEQVIVFIKENMSTKRLFVRVEDYEEEAKSILDRNAWGYYSSGATTETTLRDNVLAYNK